MCSGSPPRGAPTVYTVDIPVAAGESVPENNARSVLVQPPARPRRVLLVEGAPGFEHSFLKRALGGRYRASRSTPSSARVKNEQGADTFYVQAARSRSAALAAGYPPTREALFGYDAIVLANVEGADCCRARSSRRRATSSAAAAAACWCWARSRSRAAA